MYIAFFLLINSTYGLFSTQAHAHLMVAQHGTLNFVEQDIYMVLSLPISGFENTDENKDGIVTMIEFNHQRSAIISAVKENITLTDTAGKIALEGILLSPVFDHSDSTKPMSQLTIMGKFRVNNPNDSLRFQSTIFGPNKSEQILEVTAKRKTNSEKHSFELSPQKSIMVLFN